MSIDNIVFVFENTFVDVFKYDAKYNEMNFINTTDSFNIKQYPSNLRKIWYKLYPKLIRAYPKLNKVYDLKMLMNDIETDETLDYIPDYLIDTDELSTRVYHKLLQEDYEYQQLTTRADRKHFAFSHVANYDIPSLNMKGWNFNHYLNNKTMKIKDIPSFALSIIDIKYLIQYMNKFNKVVEVNRFANKDYNEIVVSESDKALFNPIYMLNCVMIFYTQTQRIMLKVLSCFTIHIMRITKSLTYEMMKSLITLSSN